MSSSTIPVARQKRKSTIRLEGIPADLRSLHRWVVWNYRLIDGTWKKPPYDAKTGEEADITLPATWSSFEQAWAAYQAGGYDGIGFALSSDDGYSGVDFDNAVVDGVVNPDVLTMVRHLNSYSEYSPSGTGIHVFVRGTVPGPRRKNGDRGIEMYSSERYFTVTGNVLDGAPTTIEHRQDELTALYQEVFPADDESREATPTRPVQPVAVDDEELVATMLQRPAIAALWHGDISNYVDATHPNGDHSRADLALCSHLAFYTGRDADRMDRLFRQSGLYRDKWERADYRRRTMSQAIAGCGDVYTPPHQSLDQKSDAADTVDVATALTDLLDFALSSDFGRVVAVAGAVRWLPVQQTYVALLTLARQAGRLSIAPGIHNLAIVAGLGKSSVSRHLQQLQAAGLVALSCDKHITVELIVPQRDSTAPTHPCVRNGVPLRYDCQHYLDHLNDDAFARPHWMHTQRRKEVGLAVEQSYGAVGRLVVDLLARQDATRAEMAAATGASAASIRNATLKLERDGLLLVVSVGGRTGRAKRYTLHPDFEHRLDALRPHMRTAGLGQVRTYRSQIARADYFDLQLRILERQTDPDLKTMRKVRGKRDRAAQVALAALEGLVAIGIDLRRRPTEPTPSELDELALLASELEEQIETADQASFESIQQFIWARAYLIILKIERQLTSRRRYIDDLMNLVEKPLQTAEGSA